MKLEDKANSLLNKLTHLPLAQEKTESLPKSLTDMPKKKRQIFSFWGVATILGMVGIGVALALPSLLSCGNKAKQAEGKISVGSINRAQQANFEEKKVFANSFEALGLGIATQTVNYNYSIRTNKTATFQYGVSRHKNIKSYVGGVFVVPATTTNKSESTTVSIVCEAVKSGSTTPIAPRLIKNIPTCDAGTKDLIKR